MGHTWDLKYVYWDIDCATNDHFFNELHDLRHDSQLLVWQVGEERQLIAFLVGSRAVTSFTDSFGFSKSEKIWSFVIDLLFCDPGLDLSSDAITGSSISLA